MAHLKDTTRLRGSRSELVRMAESDDATRALRLVNLLAQGRTIAQALKVIRLTDAMREQDSRTQAQA